MKRPREEEKEGVGAATTKRPQQQDDHHEEKEGGPTTATASVGQQQQQQQANTNAGKRPAPAAAAGAASGAGGGRPSPRLWVGGLHKTVKEGDILRLCVAHGRVVKEDYPFHMHGPRKGEPRGYVRFFPIKSRSTHACMVLITGLPFNIDASMHAWC